MTNTNADINTKLNNIAKEIYKSFNFNKEKVVYILDDKKEISCAYGIEINNQFSIVVGIKNYIDANEIDEVHMVYFKNTIFHEFVHAESWLNKSQSLKDSFELNKLTYAYWAYKLVDEYMAYSRANEMYKQDQQFLKKSEGEVISAFEHYCNELKFRNGRPSDQMFADIYYDLGAAFIAHRFVNSDFSTISDKNYTQFVEMYLDHLKQASENNLNEYKEYEELGRQLIEDFKLLFPFAQKRHLNSSFKYFIANSHMK